MKIRSLLLGSVAAAGLSTGVYAADLGVLTSLDICDELGLSGLTISSDTNCLQITGNVSYEFRWGDFRETAIIGPVPGRPGELGLGDGIIDTFAGNPDDEPHYDWYSKVEAWLKFVATADTDIGPAKAIIKIKEVDATRTHDTVYEDWGDDTGGLFLDEAYVSIGDSTVIMAGKKGSIANFGDSTPFNYLGLFGTSEVDTGTLFDSDDDFPYLGGHVIQITTDLGNGVSASLGLENLEGEGTVPYNSRFAGTLVGVLAYKGDQFTGHITAYAGGILDGAVEVFGVQAAGTASFDNFKLRAAVAYASVDHTTWLIPPTFQTNALHAMISGEATFDIFTLAASAEYARFEASDTGEVEDGIGVGASIGVTVTEGVAINLGARWFSANFDPADAVFGPDSDTGNVAAKVVADITETLKVTGEVGAYFNDEVIVDDTLFYGALELAWSPGGGFTSSIKGEANSEHGYRVTFKAAKAFE